MTTPLTLAAVDLGSSSGRVVVGRYDGRALRLRLAHRFPTPVREVGGALRWDLDAIVDRVGAGLVEARRTGGGDLAAMAVDTWGVDYAFVDPSGHPLADPRSYRDRLARIHADDFFSRVASPAELFAATGVEPDPITTIMQLYAELRVDPTLADRVARIAFLPDLVAGAFTRWRGTTRTIASTGAVLRAGTDRWDTALLERAGIRSEWLSPVTAEPTVLGAGTPPPTEGAPGADEGPASVIAAAGHDTAAAVHAIAPPPGTAFLSCGSWSVIGVPTPAPVVGEVALAAGLTNEASVDGRNLAMRNIQGLWLLQECERVWRSRGWTGTVPDLLPEAAHRDGGTVLDLTDPVFAVGGDMPATIRAWCDEHGLRAPADRAGTVRVVLESLADAYAQALRDLERLTGEAVTALRIVGGGVRNDLLCRLTERATGIAVERGPSEASAAGNLIAQLEALGELDPASGARPMLTGWGGVP